jgi:hypothetical protein
MTRVLFWNIEKFGKNKIDDPRMQPLKRKRKAAAPVNTSGEAQKSAERFTVIKNVITAMAPDILFVVEVNSGEGPESVLAAGESGIEGTKRLLTWLRTLDPNWRLVPPLKVGGYAKTESAGVFYRGQTGSIQRYFTGPNLWSGGPGGFSSRPEDGWNSDGTRDYGAAELNAMLVPPGTLPRQVPQTAAYNGGEMENTLAARVQFSEIGQPDNRINYGIYRAPYMASFMEQDTAAGTERNLTLFGVHTPPEGTEGGGVFAEGYPVYLYQTEEVNGTLRANETRVIGGDFNLPLLNANGTQTSYYNPLTEWQPAAPDPGWTPFTLLLRSPTPTLPLDPTARGYLETSLRRVANEPPSAPPRDGYLWTLNTPGYNYFSQSFDNILVRPFVAANGYATVLNTIVGAPYGAIPPALLNQMRSPLGPTVTVWPPATLTYDPTQESNLSIWNNFGCLRSTSDHFGLIAVV